MPASKTWIKFSLLFLRSPKHFLPSSFYLNHISIIVPSFSQIFFLCITWNVLFSLSSLNARARDDLYIILDWLTDWVTLANWRDFSENIVYIVHCKQFHQVDNVQNFLKKNKISNWRGKSLLIQQLLENLQLLHISINCQLLVSICNLIY